MPAARLVEIGERPAAIDQPITVLDHPIRIGGDQRQVALQPQGDPVIIHVRRVIIGIEVGDDHGASVFSRADGDIEPLEQAVILIGRADIVNGLATVVLEDGAGGVARRDYVVVGVSHHPEVVEHFDDRRRGTRCIGDEDDPAALPAVVHQRFDGGGVRGDAIVHDAPDIAQYRVVAGGDFAQSFNCLHQMSRGFQAWRRSASRGRSTTRLARTGPGRPTCGPWTSAMPSSKRLNSCCSSMTLVPHSSISKRLA